MAGSDRKTLGAVADWMKRPLGRMRTLLTNMLGHDDRPVYEGSPAFETSAAVWHVLADNVRSWDPDVVVLVARKMPRLAQALRLDFGASVVTDLAIPFLGSLFRGARVAIVDDVVNVGSTMNAARASVLERQASEVRLFAIGFRASDGAVVARSDVDLVDEAVVGEDVSSTLAADVPRLLRGLARPYDLDFPIIECAALPPFSNLREVALGLADCFGASQIRDVTSWDGRLTGVYRISVDVPGVAPGWLAKLRLYGSPSSDRFWVVPMAVPPALEPSSYPTKDQVWLQLTEPLDEISRAGEAGARAAMFSYSLAFGIYSLNRAQSVVQMDDPDGVFSRPEAALAFGGGVEHLAVPPDHAQRMHPVGAALPALATSPFYSHAVDSGFPEAIAAHAGNGDPGNLFEALFWVLSQRVGSESPMTYSLDWPYSSTTIHDQPYLRLRVGPTWNDLTSLIRDAALVVGGDAAAVLCSDLELSTVLDRYVDGGSVVPTFARYDGCHYRVYRKGETDPHEEIAERVSYAWAAYGKPLSLTRATKVLTVLGLAAGSDVPFSVAALERGNVACMPRTVLDESAEVATYLRNTGRLTKSSGNAADA